MPEQEQKSVTLQTSLGDITLELYWHHAPRTCENFYQLVKSNYYNDTIIHRVIADFMIQAGDPTGTGRGGSSIYGDKFEDEIRDDLHHVGAGILSMANSGPNTNGSQFFITLVNTSINGYYRLLRRGLMASTPYLVGYRLACKL